MILLAYIHCICTTSPYYFPDCCIIDRISVLFVIHQEPGFQYFYCQTLRVKSKYDIYTLVQTNWLEKQMNDIFSIFFFFGRICVASLNICSYYEHCFCFSAFISLSVRLWIFSASNALMRGRKWWKMRLSDCAWIRSRRAL